MLPLFSADSYLFTSFRRNGETGVFFAQSNDGRKWTPLNGDQPWLKPDHAGELMRDPWLGQGPDGTWHMLWTWGWTAKESGGKLIIGYANSKDLIHWSPQRGLEVMANEPAARNLWAPEAAWDAERKEWILFWATTISGRFPDTEGTGDTGYNHRIYSTTTKDFQSFTPARLWFDPGFNSIDTTLVRDGKRWIMVFKDERKNPQVKRLRLAFADSPQGPWNGRHGALQRRLGGRTHGYEDRQRVVDLFRSLHSAPALRRDADRGLEEIRGHDRTGELSCRPPAWNRGEVPGCDALDVTLRLAELDTSHCFWYSNG